MIPIKLSQPLIKGDEIVVQKCHEQGEDVIARLLHFQHNT